jgi:hypothetical protein
MSEIQTGYRSFGNDEEDSWVGIENAKPEAVAEVLAADDSEDGKSQWVWMRFPNGDLFLACAPQGDTYFSAWEKQHG